MGLRGGPFHPSLFSSASWLLGTLPLPQCFSGDCWHLPPRGWGRVGASRVRTQAEHSSGWSCEPEDAEGELADLAQSLCVPKAPERGLKCIPGTKPKYPPAPRVGGEGICAPRGCRL